MLRLYGMSSSGNCYKPRLLLRHLGIPFEHVETSANDGSTHSAEYLAKNPNGKVPLLELEDGRYLAESNAILLYLAEGTRLMQSGRYERALVHQWLFFEQYSHEPNIAVRRALMMYPERSRDATPERLEATLKGGNKALGVMEAQLRGSPYIAGQSLSVADIALFAYTHDAPSGGFDLRAFPAVAAWIERVAGEPGHVGLEASAR